MTSPNLSHEEDERNDRSMFGFWVYLMTDLLMFAVLFAVYAVLHNNTFGGESGNELFSLHTALAETLVLLTSSLTCGIALIFARQGKQAKTLLWFGITFILGSIFLATELNEFSSLIRDGQTLSNNAFLSSYFTLLGTHGLHICVGLLWLAITLIYVVKRGLNDALVRKLNMLSLFWHFLDIVWIFIFTMVYLRAFV